MSILMLQNLAGHRVSKSSNSTRTFCKLRHTTLTTALAQNLSTYLNSSAILIPSSSFIPLFIFSVSIPNGNQMQSERNQLGSRQRKCYTLKTKPCKIGLWIFKANNILTSLSSVMTERLSLLIQLPSIIIIFNDVLGYNIKPSAQKQLLQLQLISNLHQKPYY